MKKDQNKKMLLQLLGLSCSPTGYQHNLTVSFLTNLLVPLSSHSRLSIMCRNYCFLHHTSRFHCHLFAEDSGSEGFHISRNPENRGFGTKFSFYEANLCETKSRIIQRRVATSDRRQYESTTPSSPNIWNAVELRSSIFPTISPRGARRPSYTGAHI